MISIAVRVFCVGALLGGVIGLGPVPVSSQVPSALGERASADAQVDRLADALLAHLRETSADVRKESKLSVVNLDDFTAAAAQREGRYYQAQLARIARIDVGRLSPGRAILAGVLKHEAEYRSHAGENYWLEFTVTPYVGGWAVGGMQDVILAQPLSSAQDRRNYLHLLDEYARALGEIAAKTRAQAARGILLPQPAIGGVRATFTGLRDAVAQTLAPSAQRLAQVDETTRKAFADAVAARIASRIVPAYDDLLAIFDADYGARAPASVGLSQYPGGAENYQRRIVYITGLRLTPREIHERGLAYVEGLENRLAAIRALLGYKGSREDFEAGLRTDPRFFAKTPEELERKYLEFVARVEPKVPIYFSRLPKAGYGVKRVARSSEAGMTFGYYHGPDVTEPRGYYYYNGSKLDKRSLIMAPHLIYHELIPGHHFQIAQARENTSLDPIMKFLSYPSYVEGWGEYGAELAGEMGGYPSSYEEYGHLLTQMFMASRLVVDTGTNALGWSVDRGRRFMRAQGAESDEIAASEVLRYSTDLNAQALGYRLGYDQFWALRHKAEQALGNRFDVRDFHAAALGYGAMPMDVLEDHIDRFITEKKKSSDPR